MNDYIALTVASPRRLYSIRSEVAVFPANLPAAPSANWTGVWDTGASKSCISHRIVNQLNLTPAGQAQVNTANGLIDVLSYYVNFELPNQILVSNLLVTSTNLPKHVDVLIGMDVIGLGDFSITNVGGQTTFSYRVPSLETIDYTQISPSS